MDKEQIVAILKNIKYKKIIKENPLMIFDEDRVILYANTKFSETFHSRYINRKPTFLINQDKESQKFFHEISIEAMLSNPVILSFSISDHEEYIFKTLTYSAGVINSRKIYYSIFLAISDIKEKLVDDSIHALIKASQLKDNDTGHHITRVDRYSQTLANYIFENHLAKFPEIDPFFIHKIGKVASMHDIGKIGIPDYILTKPGRLDDNEFRIMKEHTINGAFILSGLAGKIARDIALFHHEKWDGTGYPYFLREDSIPLCARIVAISDVYDALRMERCYKPSFSHRKAVDIMKSQSGKHFDPGLFIIFMEICRDFDEIYKTLGD